VFNQQEQIQFTNHSFSGGHVLHATGESVDSKWRPEASKWLLILTHTNSDGDLWFEIDERERPWATPLEQFIGAVFDGRKTYNVNLVLFVCGSIIHSTKTNTKTKLRDETMRTISVLQRYVFPHPPLIISTLRTMFN
jgi:hypothetical protein